MEEKEIKSEIKSKGKIATITVIVVLIIAMISSFLIYTGIYYKADDYALSFLKSDDNVTYKVENNNLIFEPKNKASKGFVFYPGAKVEDKAYAPLASQLAHKGIYTVICHMRFNLAFFSTNAANKVIDNNPNITFSIGGHSLGGVAASTYAFNNTAKVESMIFLASYTTKDFTSKSTKFLSIYGSNDKVLKLDKYKSSMAKLPNLEEHIIQGGNHGYFGSYGEQKGDGVATITKQEQVAVTVDYIYNFINSL